MATNPWNRFSKSPWVLMVGSGSLGDDGEVYKGKAGTSKEGRTVTDYNRANSVAKLKIVLDHLIKSGPRLLRKNKEKGELIFFGHDHADFMYRNPNIDPRKDFYFGSRTDNRVRTLQHNNGLVVDGMVGKGTMSKLWQIGRSDRIVRRGEWEIRTLMFEFLWNKSDYRRVG